MFHKNEPYFSFTFQTLVVTVEVLLVQNVVWSSIICGSLSLGVSLLFCCTGSQQ